MFVWFDLLSHVSLPFPPIFFIKQSCCCHTFLESNNVLAAEKFGEATGMEISVPSLLCWCLSNAAESTWCSVPCQVCCSTGASAFSASALK